MAFTRDDALRAVREAAEEAGSIPVELDEEYLSLIERVEADPANRSGADKSWVGRGAAAFRRQVRPSRRP
jgi:hypothetical protein